MVDSLETHPGSVRLAVDAKLARNESSMDSGDLVEFRLNLLGY